MGADIQMSGDELIIRNSSLTGCEVDSWGDHRIAMSFCIAGLFAEGETVVNRVESASVSFPGFDSSLASLGGLM